LVIDHNKFLAEGKAESFLLHTITHCHSSFHRKKSHLSKSLNSAQFDAVNADFKLELETPFSAADLGFCKVWQGGRVCEGEGLSVGEEDLRATPPSEKEVKFFFKGNHGSLDPFGSATALHRTSGGRRMATGDATYTVLPPAQHVTT
jgi:hypothetical protein